ncbi:MAG: hypothetical protein ABI361_01425 [Nitrososphaera sp.]
MAQPELSFEQLPLPPPGTSEFNPDPNLALQNNGEVPSIELPSQQLHSGDNIVNFVVKPVSAIYRLSMNYTQNGITTHAPIARSNKDGFKALLHLETGNVTILIYASNFANMHASLQKDYVVSAAPSIWDRLVTQLASFAGYLWSKLGM